MRISTILLTVSVMAIFAEVCTAATDTVPAYTVVQVTVNQQLSSATANVGDRFTANCSTVDCGGFPALTVFTAIVTSVTRASGRTPGQIGAAFIEARLPDGTMVNVDGRLTSLDAHEVLRNSQDGRLERRPERRDERNKFIAYGPGAATVVGVFTGSVLNGGLIDGPGGWVAEATVGADDQGQTVVVPAGAQFGVVLVRDAILTMAVSTKKANFHADSADT
ncbi:MAG: hypothetical protein ACYC64_06490 [Armatimonadota bacterium]